MSTHGKLLDSEPMKDDVYNLFTQYFKNPNMTKIKNVENFSTYMAKTYCLLSRECKYIIAIVRADNYPIGFTEHLSNLRWLNIQTRTLFDKHNLDSHSYVAAKGGEIDCAIQRIKITDKASIYKCDGMPLMCYLLHNEKKNEHTYSDKGSLVSAIETYETIISFDNM